MVPQVCFKYDGLWYLTKTSCLIYRSSSKDENGISVADYQCFLKQYGIKVIYAVKLKLYNYSHFTCMETIKSSRGKRVI